MPLSRAPGHTIIILFIINNNDNNNYNNVLLRSKNKKKFMKPHSHYIVVIANIIAGGQRLVYLFTCGKSVIFFNLQNFLYMFSSYDDWWLLTFGRKLIYTISKFYNQLTRSLVKITWCIRFEINVTPYIGTIQLLDKN